MSPENVSFQVAGVDGCKAGWLIAVIAGRIGSNTTAAAFELKRLLVAETFMHVLSSTQDCWLVCVDIPIGLNDPAPIGLGAPANGPEMVATNSGEGPCARQPIGAGRECDVAARRLLGPRASSVFPAPIRPCLAAADYATACRISFEHSGRKLSKQSFALLTKIRQVDDLMTPALQGRVREIHPEVSFWALNGNQPMPQNKKTIPGQAQRRKLLEEVFIGMDDVLAQAPKRGYAMDDALDALAAAWTAAQAIMGKAKTLPAEPELDSKGLRMEILCPGW